MRQVNCTEADAVSIFIKVLLFKLYANVFTSRILHSNGFTEEEINEKKAIVYSNVVSSICTILKVSF